MPDPHIYADDGIRDPRGEGRCVTCGLPARNARHDIPDRSDQQNEHRRRAGEGDDET